MCQERDKIFKVDEQKTYCTHMALNAQYADSSFNFASYSRSWPWR
jgi:hypothetical protein